MNDVRYDSTPVLWARWDSHIQKNFLRNKGQRFQIYVLWKTFNENLFHFFPRAHIWEQKSGCETSIVLSHFFREFTPGTVLRVFGYCNCVKRFCCDAVVQKEVETVADFAKEKYLMHLMWFWSQNCLTRRFCLISTRPFGTRFPLFKSTNQRPPEVNNISHGSFWKKKLTEMNEKHSNRVIMDH